MLSPSDSQDRESKSKKVLTELLDVQIDLNEKLKEENNQYLEQQKKFLALITKKEKIIDELKINLQKNAKPLFIFMNNLILENKNFALSNLKSALKYFWKKKSLEKVLNKMSFRNLRKHFIGFKINCIRKTNKISAAIVLITFMKKIDIRKQIAFSKLFKTCFYSKQKNLQNKITKIASFKIFYFAEKVERIIYKKKCYKIFLLKWRNNVKLMISNDFKMKNMINIFQKLQNQFFLNNKFQFLLGISKEKESHSQKYHNFISLINKFICKKVFWMNEFISFEKIKAYAREKNIFEKKISKIATIFFNLQKRRLIFELKLKTSQTSKAKLLFHAVKTLYAKQVIQCFWFLRESPFQIPYFDFSCFQKKKKNVFRDKNKSIFSTRSKISKKNKKNKKISLPEIKNKLMSHNNATQTFFLNKKNEFEVYCSTMMKLMKESQENLEKKNEEQKNFLQNKKIQDDNYHKLVQENQLFGKQLLEKQEALKIQTKDKEKMEINLKKLEDKYHNDLEKLTKTIDSLATDKGELLTKLEETFQNLNELRNEYSSICNKLKTTENEKNKIIEAFKLQEKKIYNLEKKIEESENHMRKKSPLPQQNNEKDKQKEKNQDKSKEKIEKIQKEKKDLEEKFKQLNEKHDKIKKLNMDLTKEAIALNEEKFEVKNIITTLKDNLHGAKNTIIALENKTKQLENEIGNLKQENHSLQQKNSKKQENIANKMNDENNFIKNENNKLRSEIEKLTTSLNNSLNKINLYEDKIQSLLKTLENYKTNEQQMNNEFKSLNDSLALLNKEKVNLMREMTLIHENNLLLEKELNKYKDLAFQCQNEIENYQNQLDVYSKVLKIMQEKVNNIENKSFEAVNKTQKLNESLNNTDILNKILNLKSRLNQHSPEKGEPEN